jgi:uncharacterized RDD family membrane protein YckC
MVFWIIRDGEKEGPFEDYQFREMIRAGKVGADQRVWHEGAESWLRADEVGILEREFADQVVEPPPLPREREPFRPWRRFGARFFDFFLYSLLLVAVARVTGSSMRPEPDAVPSVWLIIGTVFPAILIECALVGGFGRTPGKYLLNMRIERLDGSLLTTGEAFVRSMRVWILGMGMMQWILMILGHVLSLWFGLKNGAMLWDLQSGFEVRSEELDGKQITIYWIALLAMFVASLWLVWPEVVPAYEDMQRQMK